MRKMVVTGVLLCSLFWNVTALAGSEMVLIIKVVERQSGPELGVVIDQMTLTAGSVSVVRPPKKVGKGLPHVLQLLNSDNAVIYSKEFNFIRHLEVPLPEPGSEKKSGPTRVQLEEPEAVLVIPYMPEGKMVRVQGPKGHTKPSPVPAMPLPSPSDVIESTPPPAREGNLYILIMASGYININDFQTKAQEMQNYLYSREPFASRSSSVAISIYENTADLGCYTGCFGIDRLMCCDSSKVITAAVDSGHLFDEIIIIHNTSTYSGGGYRDHGSYQTDSTYSYCQVYSGDFSVPMVMHEFGHSFGNLCDEYTYGSEGYTYYDCANCRANCLDWADVSSTCELSCDARSDYYRPEDSIMLSLDIPSYNQPSIHNSLIPRLNYFAPPSIEPDRLNLGPIFELLLPE